MENIYPVREVAESGKIAQIWKKAGHRHNNNGKTDWLQNQNIYAAPAYIYK